MKQTLILILFSIVTSQSFALSFDLKQNLAEPYFSLNFNSEKIGYHDLEKNSCKIQINKNAQALTDNVFKATYLKEHTEKDALFSKGYSQFRFEGTNSQNQFLMIICRSQTQQIKLTEVSQILQNVGTFNN